MLRKFQERIYGKCPQGILVWESSWDSFRPTEKIVWNPQTKRVEPFYGEYCSELFDVNYGYGEHEDMCSAFTDEHLEDIETAPECTDIDEFWTWTGQTMEWFYDRPVCTHPCSQKPTRNEYLSILNLRARTARRIPRQIRGTFKQRNRK